MRTVGCIALIFLWACFSGCTYRHQEDPVPVCNPDVSVSFESTVQPVISANCAVEGCHNGSNPSVPTLTTFEQVKNNSQDILLQVSNNVMPPAGATPLTAKEKEAITCWINQGASTP